MTPAIQPQPNLLHGSYTQIMVKPMQLQEHKFTAWLERLVEARKNRQNKKNVHTELTENHTMMLKLVKIGGTGPNLVTKSSQHRSLKSNRLWIISTASMMMSWKQLTSTIWMWMNARQPDRHWDIIQKIISCPMNPLKKSV